MTTSTRARPARELLSEVGRGLGPHPALPRLLAAAERLAADPRAVASMLTRIRTSPESLAEVGRLSVWHPNGFAKIVLHRDGERRFGVRLHVWPEGSTRAADSDPHSHRWEFASALLAGPGLRITEFAECAAGDTYERCSYGGSGPPGDGLVATGRIGLRRTGETVLPAGAAYPCATSDVHTVEPLGHALMATLVLQGPQCSASTVVYRRDRRVRGERPVPLSSGELGRLLDAVARGLSPAGEDPG